MKFLLTTGLLIIFSVANATESKVVCTENGRWSDENKTKSEAINLVIEKAKQEGFTTVTDLTSVDNGGSTEAFCVLVTKP
ncbi:MAG: hypothetical protein JNM93_07545 [Bacteriovoracaceae bacterium]|nr:hypothetical protein [Bacteriovoracaceae bacterium]